MVTDSEAAQFPPLVGWADQKFFEVYVRSISYLVNQTCDVLQHFKQLFLFTCFYEMQNKILVVREWIC